MQLTGGLQLRDDARANNSHALPIFFRRYIQMFILVGQHKRRQESLSFGHSNLASNLCHRRNLIHDF